MNVMRIIIESEGRTFSPATVKAANRKRRDLGCIAREGDFKVWRARGAEVRESGKLEDSEDRDLQTREKRVGRTAREGARSTKS